jgi:hypothetical protein
MHALGLELLAPFDVDQRGSLVGKAAVGILRGLDALRLHEDGPAGAEPAQRIVEPRGGADQFGRRGAVEIGTTEARCALKRTVLVQNDAPRDEGGPGQVVGEADGAVAVFGEV